NFFFQAEDGIRDFHVTGVQTCALPISTKEAVREKATVKARSRKIWEAIPSMKSTGTKTATVVRVEAVMAMATSRAPTSAASRARSEERRVGEEGRSRRGPDANKTDNER